MSHHGRQHAHDADHDERDHDHLNKTLHRILRKQNFHQLLLLVILQQNQTLRNIMGQVQDAVNAYVVANTEFNTRTNTAIDNIAADQQRLKDLLAAIDNSGSQWTPQDQSNLDTALGITKATTEKLEALATATEDPPAPPVV